MSKRPQRTIHKLRSNQAVTLVGFGDSLTYGWNADKGYLDFLHETLARQFPKAHLTILNRGVPGDTAAGGIERLGFDIVEAKPDCVVIQFGLNDVFSGYDVAMFRRNMLRLIEGLETTTEADLVLTTSVWFDMPSVYDHAFCFYQCIEDIAQERELPIVRLHARWKQHIDNGSIQRHLVQADGIHPTREGYYLMADIIAELFMS